jgi:uncharacterized protein
MNRTLHFEIQADEPERAATFYSEIFGWTIKKIPRLGWNFWMVMTADKDSKGPGINGGLLNRPSKIPATECGANFFCLYHCCRKLR